MDTKIFIYVLIYTWMKNNHRDTFEIQCNHFILHSYMNNPYMFIETKTGLILKADLNFDGIDLLARYWRIDVMTTARIFGFNLFCYEAQRKK